MAMIYCHYEPGNFPDTEFYRSKNGQLIHKRGRLHYDTGDPVNPLDNKPLPAKIQLILEQSRKDASLMEEKDIQTLLDHIQNKNGL